jgi:hypothetical protein
LLENVFEMPRKYRRKAALVCMKIQWYKLKELYLKYQP